ncbi:MAG: TrkA family potassium uptake protein [Ruminococcaceae bacterium]|nr:TrkA family potassium uptake protein [Oscillospiraceae bacterium]
MKSYIVVGMGRFGSEVARQLHQLRCEVIAMDISDELIQQVAPYVTHAVVGDAQDKQVLRALSVKDMDCAIIAIGDDLAASVLVTMNMKELGVPYVICKAHDATYRKVLEKLGADRVIIPEQEQAQRLAKSLSTPNVLDYIELSDECGIIEMPVPESWLGKDLRQLNVRAKLGVSILAVRRNGKMQMSLSPDTAFIKGDVLVVLGDNQALRKVQKL